MKPILVLLNPKNLLAHCLIIQHNLDTICICSPLREVSVLTPHAISAHLELYKTHQSVVGPSVLVLSLTITKILIFYLFLPGCDFFLTQLQRTFAVVCSLMVVRYFRWSWLSVTCSVIEVMWSIHLYTS